jgi:tetratricopeptide (TPR) repeat protein
MLGLKQGVVLITFSLLLPFFAYADDSNAPLDGKQEALLKLFLPSLFNKAPSKEVSIPSETSSAQKMLGVLPASLMGTMEKTILKITFPQKPYYEIASDDSHQIITLTFTEVGQTVALPELDTLNTAIERVTYAVGSENQFVVTLLLAPNVDVKGLHMEGNRPAEFVLDLGLGPAFSVPTKMKGVKTSGVYEPLVKKPVPLSPEEIFAKNMDEAVSLLSQQRAADALKVLKTAVPKEMASHLSYYVVLAEAYRQSGNALEAERIYLALTKQEPNNADWLVGLGMCYEMRHQQADAFVAYNKALQLGNLSPSLQQYVVQALKRGA